MAQAAKKLRGYRSQDRVDGKTTQVSAEQPAGGMPNQLPAKGGEPNPEEVAPKEGREPVKAGKLNEPVARKKISNGRIDVAVKEFDSAAGELKSLVKNVKGYIASSDDNGVVGSQRSGTYTVRVPAEEYDSFMDTVAVLGELRRRTSDTKDITDQYYDLDAHVKNDEVREKGLQKLYEKTAEKGRIEELLVVDRELSTIRGRIEEQRGRLKRWDKEVAMSTVVVHLSQRAEYEAPGTVSGPPDFGTTIGRTWDGSLHALTAFGKGLVLVVVAVAPWLAVLVVVMSPLWFLLWRQYRLKRTAKPTQAVPPITVQPV